jgi:hypothetical protein
VRGSHVIHCHSSTSMECRREGVGGSSCESERQRERAQELERDRNGEGAEEKERRSDLFCLYSRSLLPL